MIRPTPPVDTSPAAVEYFAALLEVTGDAAKLVRALSTQLQEAQQAKDTITLTQLREWCKDFDAVCGVYPDYILEGWAVFTYLQQRLNGRPKEDEPDNTYRAPEDWYPLSEEG